MHVYFELDFSLYMPRSGVVESYGSSTFSFLGTSMLFSGASLVTQLVKILPARQKSACSTVDLGLIPGSGRSPEEGNSSPFRYSCLGNSMDRGTWWTTVHGVKKSWT